MQLILDDNQTTSAEFTASQQFGFLLGNHQGGTWVAEILTPDGDWVVLNDADYNRNGAWVSPAFPGGGDSVHWWQHGRAYLGRRGSGQPYKAEAIIMLG